VWYESKLEVPLTQKYKVFTGESYKRFYVVLGGRALQVTGYGKPSYAESETEEVRKTLQWRQYALPIGWMTENVREASVEEQAIDTAAARAAGLERAKAEILMGAGEEARFVSYNVLQEKTENGKVYMNVLFQVEEAIVEELPIVQGE